MSLDMFLFILWSFESFSTKLAPMWLQWNVNANVRRDVIPLDDFSVAATPSTDQVQVIGAFAPNVGVAYMILVRIRKSVPEVHIRNGRIEEKER